MSEEKKCTLCGATENRMAVTFKDGVALYICERECVQKESELEEERRQKYVSDQIAQLTYIPKTD